MLLLTQKWFDKTELFKALENNVFHKNPDHYKLHHIICVYACPTQLEEVLVFDKKNV